MAIAMATDASEPTQLTAAAPSYGDGGAPPVANLGHCEIPTLEDSSTWNCRLGPLRYSREHGSQANSAADSAHVFGRTG